MLAALWGLALGLAIGAVLVSAALGSYLGKSPDLSRLDIAVDMDETVPVPDLGGKPVPESSRRFLDYAPLWAKWPDYDRVLFMNTIIATLWPYYNSAIGKIAVKEAAAPLDAICKKVPLGLLQAIDIEALDLGTKALAIGGIKAYTTKDDSCVFEAPIQWGSDMRVRIGVRLKFGPFVVHLPLEVAGVQVRALARISLRPLVEELPCLGGAEVSLLEQPYYDLTVRLGTAIDLMRLPFLKPAIDCVVRKVVADMLLYPNKFAVELMPGGGLPPPPLGMVEVTIHSVTDINGGGSLLGSVDPYVEVQCRKGRVTRTRTAWNDASPAFEETIAAIVDDPDNQALNLRLVDDKGGYNDVVIGELSLPLLESAFFRAPREPVRLVLPFAKPAAEEDDEDGEGGGGGVGGDATAASPSTQPKKESLRERVRRQRRAKQNRPEVGLLTCTARYLPFKVDPAQLERLRRAKEARAAAAKAEADKAVEEATKELAEAEAAVASAAAGSKREVEELGAAKRRLERAVSRAAGAGVDREGVKAAAAAEAGTAAATSSTGDAPAVTVADARQEVAEAEEAAEDAVAAAAKVKAAVAGRDKAAAAEAAGKAAAAGKAPAPAVTTFLEGPLTDDTKGILTLTLVKARNLTASGQVDPFVELSLLDPATGVPQKQWSATWNNEPNPRWGEKFDFVNVSATSILTITVWDKKGIMEAAFAALKGLTLKRVMTEKIGSLRLRVDEVARNRRIKDEWALQETQKGDITLALEWFPVEVEGTGGEAAAVAAAPAAAASGLAGL